jgi:cyclopropane-fatty-acyl-phospholipid synthase
MSQTRNDAANSSRNAANQARGQNRGLLRKLVLNKLQKIEHGVLHIVEQGETLTFGTADTRCNVNATIQVNDSSAFSDVALGGAVAAAEAYMSGKWETSNLTGVARIFAANPHVLGQLSSGTAKFLLPLLRVAHKLKRNSKSQSRRNIAAHYDLGNEFFELFLDPTLSYSASIYPSQESSLEEAAVNKLDIVCQKLVLEPSDHLLEIGTGWGALAIHAAKNYGCRVTTTTISERQHQLAKQRIEAAGLNDRITLLKSDYRDLTGKFDKLVSIEMIEAVGHDYMGSYIKTCSDRLHSHGRVLIQAILMPDYCFDGYRGSVDFIQKYIFPGGALPSIGNIMEAAAKHGDLHLHSVQDISLHYARTLNDWRSHFNKNANKIRAMGYPDEFIKMWEYYFCYCEGGFIERTITTAQLVLDKPGCRLPVDTQPLWQELPAQMANSG